MNIDFPEIAQPEPFVLKLARSAHGLGLVLGVRQNLVFDGSSKLAIISWRVMSLSRV